MTKLHIKPLMLLIMLGVIWGTGYSIARFAMTSGVPALGYSFWQSLGPAILILLFNKISSTDSIKKTTTSSLIYYTICGITGIVIPNTNMYFAAPHLPAGLLAVIVNTVPILAYPMALMARSESFQWPRFLAVLFAVAGLMLIVIPKSSLPSLEMIPWVFQALLTPFCFAFCSVYISKFEPKNREASHLAGGTLLASSIILIPIVFFTQNFYFFHFPLNTADKVIFLEIILSTAGYILFFKLIKIAGPVYYSFVNTIVSLTGLFWGYIIFHETLNEWTSAAVFCILLALIFVNYNPLKILSSFNSRFLLSGNKR